MRFRGVFVTNIAAYKFVALDDLKSGRAELREHCHNWRLKGTIDDTPIFGISSNAFASLPCRLNSCPVA